MPSTSAKQHRFMQAVAHSPSFAKKAGVSQSVGKDFSAADKGKTFNKGGMMKKGKRFSGEDGKSEVTNPYSGPSDLHDYYKTKYAPEAKAEAKESKPVKEEASEDTGAVTGRADRKYAKNMPSDEKKAESAERIKDMTMAAASLTPIGGLGRVGAAFVPAGRTYRERQNFLRESEKAYTKQRGELSRGESLTPGPNLYGRRGFTSRDAADAVARKYGETGMKQGGSIMESKSIKFAMGGSMPSPGGARPDPRMIAAMRAQQAVRQQPMRRPPPGGMPPPAQPPMGMNKGGMAHGGMHKMPDGKMMKNSDMKMRGMKAGGMPMKDGKPAFMQKKMMGGGMAYAKGGGIESRGKTKGTVIRMAAGGSVSSRADGIAQRGKTKFTNY